MTEYQWSDLHVGLAHSFDTVVTPAMMQRFQQDTGDINPMHVDESFARERGFDGAVVYGLLTSSFYSTLVGVYLPGKYALLHGIQIDFHKPVYVGVPLTVRGEISYLNDAFKRLEIAAEITTTEGARLSKARIRAGVHG